MKAFSTILAACAILAATITPQLAHAADPPTPLTRLEERDFGKLADGTAVKQFILRNAGGMTVKVITLGGIISDLETPDRNGAMTNIVMGADSLDRFTGRGGVSGAIMLGRVANRIAGARFTLDGVALSPRLRRKPSGPWGWNSAAGPRILRSRSAPESAPAASK